MTDELGTKTIVVTGYGSFGSFHRNPAQVTVEMLAERLNSSSTSPLAKELSAHKMKVITKIVSVDYADAAALSKEVCEKMQAEFVIHVGVHPTIRCINLETTSFRNGNVPLGNCCILCPDSCSAPPPSKVLKTCLDCEKLKDHITRNESAGLSINISTDPGRFLCAYIYYCSLYLNAGRSLFVHIPPFTGEEESSDDEEPQNDKKNIKTLQNSSNSHTNVTPELLTDMLERIIIGVAEQIS
ncbi:pyroglutamyl peptidase domain-containing protein [Ditylenchus destructor]|uniref:Pyroglutamyl peptidase domain-containing protein n=1 Tax=Ditylenchus destructor TaxID=166010 RepID=A0AAD4NJI6_9BILA|nr:pyroglutamyl peptidase domain-containing protein [Ditylenchus destructor]